MLGDILPRRNSAWLNAGPRALIAFSGSNGDLKFPMRLPITSETHEVQIYDVCRGLCCEAGTLEQQTLDMQGAMAAAAGYFGGYTAKMQPVGSRETQRMAGAVGRKVSVEDRGTEAEEFQKYSRNLVKNLEAKGIARTALESTNLQLFADHPDPLMAECIRTFPSVTFPASLLLKREERETLEVPGRPSSQLFTMARDRSRASTPKPLST